MGGAMGMAWQDVIGYHTTYPHHFSFQRYYATYFNVYPILNVPEKHMILESRTTTIRGFFLEEKIHVGIQH